MKQEILGDIGHCIYCAKCEGLSNEHIIPLALGGRAVLKNASCEDCAAITSRFEQDVARNLWPSTRFLYGLQSRRRPLQRPESFPVRVITKDGDKHKIELPPGKYGGVTPFIHFAIPGHLSGVVNTGIITLGHSLNRNGGLDFKLLKREFSSPVVAIELYTKFSPTDFARMLAKVAYGYAVAQYGSEAVRNNSYVLPAILGQREDIGMWVGDALRDTQDPKQDFGIEIFEEDGEIRAHIRFFGRLKGSITYLVILGKLPAVSV